MPDNQGRTTRRDIQKQTHSWRNFEPEQFIEVAKTDGEANAREALKYVEDGRFYPMLKEAYNFFIPLDPDEKREWVNRNSDMAEWVGVYAALEHLNPYTDYTGIESLL